jgi:hypothetical protein
LILADAINYGMEKYNTRHQAVDAVLDIATLTGGKVVAIGDHNAVGLAGNNPDLLNSANQLLTHNLRRKTGTLLVNQAFHKAVTQAHGTGGQADAINASGAGNFIRAGVMGPLEGVTNPIEDAKKFKKDPAPYRQNPHFTKMANFASFGDGAAFLQAVGLDSIRRNARGKVIGEQKPNTPWLHFDIAGAEFGPADEKHGGREWATGIGVPDLYLTLKGLDEGHIPLTPEHTHVQ